jgi:glycerophosphoryl diester phosphodiesterase
MQTNAIVTTALPVRVKELPSEQIIVAGRQGCRGVMPGNTLPAFMHAVKTGTRIIELDIMLSADGQIVVTDHPELSPLHYYHQEDKGVRRVYELTVDELQQYDCGKRFSHQYPHRKMVSCTIPLLKDVFSRIEKYILWNNAHAVRYFIDVKTSPDTDHIFHPKPEEIILKLTDLIRSMNIGRRCTVISTDVRPLQLMKRLNQKVNIGLKVENEESVTDNIEALGFIPELYLPSYACTDGVCIHDAQVLGMKVVPSGANELLDMNELLSMGVDGLLTDYPMHALKLVEY